jgi:hypothetical protein
MSIPIDAHPAIEAVLASFRRVKLYDRKAIKPTGYRRSLRYSESFIRVTTGGIISVNFKPQV